MAQASHFDSCFDATRQALSAHIRLNDHVIASMLGRNELADILPKPVSIPNDVGLAIFPMFLALGSSANTLIVLSDKPGLQTRDCFSICRSIVELAVNLCYLIGEGEEAARRALRHARQKSFRDLQRKSQIGDEIIHIGIETAIEPDSIPGLLADLAEFETPRGSEKNWTDLSLDDRILAVKSRFGGNTATLLHLARVAVYRHSSEILHGSVFGQFFFFGMTATGERQSAASTIQQIGQQHMMLLLVAVSVLNATYTCFDKQYGFAWLKDRADSEFEKVRRHPYYSKTT